MVMTTAGSHDDVPLIELRDVEKAYQALRPLRIARFSVARGQQYALSGFDAGAAEAFVHLVTGAMLPDRGDVRVAGRSTRDIATDVEWLSSLDKFGIVTERAVLVEPLSAEANLALPLTLAVEPLVESVRTVVHQLADEVGLPRERLAERAGSLTTSERIRLHLARALAPRPDLLLLEHATARLDSDASRAFGQTLRDVSTSRGLAWLALTADEAFAQAAGGIRLHLDAATGRLAPAGGFWRRMVAGSRAR
jgi:predicted ABC-type transport system involved in lysophospholipase L1 biosynthesis ATPase subunit